MARSSVRVRVRVRVRFRVRVRVRVKGQGRGVMRAQMMFRVLGRFHRAWMPT